ncbi:hypothetical protein PR048_000483 [Dryococelus australis]|uniref:Uncharacterized protein n=1 Tax=Dryococelus australis TaxID=614101 RepID=A0ABQ9IER3_9NEOP|nr:hypothetical protein PR048_000483 [Dryococelus australis]
MEHSRSNGDTHFNICLILLMGHFTGGFAYSNGPAGHPPEPKLGRRTHEHRTLFSQRSEEGSVKTEISLFSSNYVSVTAPHPRMKKYLLKGLSSHGFYRRQDIPTDRRRSAEEVTSGTEICDCGYHAVEYAAGSPDYWTKCVSHFPSRTKRRPSGITCNIIIYSHSMRAHIPFPNGMSGSRLARSLPTKANRVQYPAGSPNFRKWESCRRFFSGISHFPAPSFRCRSIFTSITVIGSQDLASKESFAYVEFVAVNKCYAGLHWHSRLVRLRSGAWEVLGSNPILSTLECVDVDAISPAKDTVLRNGSLGGKVTRCRRSRHYGTDSSKTSGEGFRNFTITLDLLIERNQLLRVASQAVRVSCAPLRPLPLITTTVW